MDDWSPPGSGHGKRQVALLQELPPKDDYVNVEDLMTIMEKGPYKRVRAVQEYEGKLWVFVDDIEAGAPMEQVEVVEKGTGIAAAAAGQPPRLALPVKNDDEPEKAGVRKSRFALAEGDVVVTFPDNLSADSVEDLDGFCQVFIKKARREAGTKQ
jgi:hypothetical protein